METTFKLRLKAARDPGVRCRSTLWFLLSSRRRALLSPGGGVSTLKLWAGRPPLGVVFQAPLIKEVTESG